MSKNNLPMIMLVGALPAKVEELISARLGIAKIHMADPTLLTEKVAQEITGIACVGNVGAGFIDALPRLEIIASFGVGYDGVDVAHARRKNIVVTNTPDVLNEEVADATIGLLINVTRELPQAESWLRAGNWRKGTSYPLTARTLRNRKAGIFGMGRIGKAIARRLEGFGLPVAYHNRRPLDDVSYTYYPSLISLADAVDILICAAPGGPSTDRAIGTKVFEALGQEGIFINIGRGSTVDEAALIHALEYGTISAAGLDVFANEPDVSAALLALPNVSLLPHVASASVQARGAVASLVAGNLLSWFEDGQALTSVPETADIAIRSAAPYRAPNT